MKYPFLLFMYPFVEQQFKNSSTVVADAVDRSSSMDSSAIVSVSSKRTAATGGASSEGLTTTVVDDNVFAGEMIVLDFPIIAVI